MAGMSLDGIWLEHLEKSESTVRVLQVFEYDNMNVFVHKKRVTSRCSGQRRDGRANVATFQRVIFVTSRRLGPTS